MKIKGTLFIIIGLFLWITPDGTPARGEEKKTTPSSFAIVTYIKGDASYLPTGEIEWRPLYQGTRLGVGTQIKTMKDSRIELKLPDGSYIRFAEETRFEIQDLYYEREKVGIILKVRVFLGKVWANVRKLFTKRSRFEVSSRTSVAGVRGTIYRMDVEKDETTVIKVYKGEIYVIPPPKEIPKPYYEIEGPKEIARPYTVIPGPNEVTLQEWEYIVQSMQEIVIRPDGQVIKPAKFDPVKDLDDWVRWNKERDILVED
jgi:hypothetical protein